MWHSENSTYTVHTVLLFGSHFITSITPLGSECFSVRTAGVRAQLEELVLYGNPLESLPPELFALSRVHTLRLSAREFAETARLDAHTEQLIARNQLHSVHIPNVIFELPALRALDLTGVSRWLGSAFSTSAQLFPVACSQLNARAIQYEYNHCCAEAKLNTLPATLTQSLEQLSLRHNYFRSLPYSLCQLPNLTHLDASINRLSRVPDDIRNLRSLKVLLTTLHRSRLACLSFSITVQDISLCFVLF